MSVAGVAVRRRGRRAALEPPAIVATGQIIFATREKLLHARCDTL